MVKLIGKVFFENRKYFVTPKNKHLNVLIGNYKSGFQKTNKFLNINEVTFDIPFKPNKLIGIGKNYPSHEDSQQDINFFLMTNNALIAHKKKLYLSKKIGSLIPEGELAVVLSKTVRNISPEDAKKVILGYTICNDFSARDVQSFQGEKIPASIKKSSDGLLPLGPYFLLEDELKDFTIKTYKNKKLIQKGSTREMINNIPNLISYISTFFTLERFDLIATGTPEPKTKSFRNDKIIIEVSGIGKLENIIC